MKKRLLILGVVVIAGLVMCHREEVGLIAVNSDPQGAAIYLDDSLTGEVTNCVLEDVPVGEHNIKLTLEGYVDWDTLIEVKSDTSITITATMIPESDTADTIQPGSLVWKSAVEGNSDYLLYSNGTIYVVSKDNTALYALSKEDGSVEWQYGVESGYKLKFPMVAPNGNIYLTEEFSGVTEDDHVKIVSLYSNGSVRWKIGKGLQALEVCRGAVGADNTLYLINHGYNDDMSSYLYKLEAYTEEGTLKWSYPLPASAPISIGAYGQIYVLVTESDDTLFPSGLYAFNSDGTYEWCYQLSYAYPDYPSYCGIAIGQAGEVYFLDSDYYLTAINYLGGFEWVYSGEEARKQAVVGEDGTIYLGVMGLRALNPDGSLKWRKSTASVCLATPLVGADSTVYFDATEGLYALDIEDGTVKWKYAPTNEFIIVGQFALTEDGLFLAWMHEEGESGGYYLRAIKTESKGLANSSWPKYQADNRCTGCAAF